MTAKEQKLMKQLRDRGYAIIIFTPEELGNVSPDRIEYELVAYAWDTIDMLKDEYDDEATASVLIQK